MNKMIRLPALTELTFCFRRGRGRVNTGSEKVTSESSGC